jgi:hypothetical protein
MVESSAKKNRADSKKGKLSRMATRSSQLRGAANRGSGLGLSLDTSTCDVVSAVSTSIDLPRNAMSAWHLRSLSTL